MFKIMLSVAVLTATMGNAQAAVSAVNQLGMSAGPACNKCVSLNDISVPAVVSEEKVAVSDEEQKKAVPVRSSADGRIVPVPAGDFFPIRERISLVYEYVTSDQAKGELIEISFDQVNQAPGETVALARVLRLSDRNALPTSFFARRNAAGVFSFDYIHGTNRMEFPTVLTPKAQWNSSVGIEQIETLRGWVVVPAGRFYNCLKIVTRIGGGDLGTAIRYYAPGIGLVYEEVRAEDVQMQFRLVSVRRK